jgi:hypothetical protein
MYSQSFQTELINLKYAKLSDDNKFIITNKSAIRNFIIPRFGEYMHQRNLSIKGLSKPIQLKTEAFLDTFNKIFLSPKKSHNFKTTSSLLYGSYTTDSNIKLIKHKESKKINGKWKKRKVYSIKIGRETYKLKNRNFNIKHFEIKTANLSRKNGKYYLSISGIETVKRPELDERVHAGIDINYEDIVLSNTTKFKTENLQNRLNLFSEKLKGKQQKKSKKELYYKERLYRDMLLQDREYRVF